MGHFWFPHSLKISRTPFNSFVTTSIKRSKAPPGEYSTGFCFAYIGKKSCSVNFGHVPRKTSVTQCIYSIVASLLIVSFRFGTALFWGNPPCFLGTPLFLKKFKKLPPLWQSSNLVHVSCIKLFKMKVFVLYYTSQLRISLSLLFIFSGSTLIFTADSCFG